MKFKIGKKKQPIEQPNLTPVDGVVQPVQVPRNSTYPGSSNPRTNSTTER